MTNHADQQTPTTIEPTTTTAGRIKIPVRDQLFPLLYIFPLGIITAIGAYYFNQLLNLWIPDAHVTYTLDRAVIAAYTIFAVLQAFNRRWLTAALTFLLLIPGVLIAHALMLLLPH